MNDPLANRSIHTFQAAQVDPNVILLSSARGARALLWCMALFLGAAIWWASWAQIDQAISGQGKVIPSSQVKIVQNLEGGVLADLMIEEGQTVDIGQPLLKIDDTRFQSDFLEHSQQLASLSAMIIRIEALLASVIIDPKQSDWQQQVQIQHQPLSLPDLHDDTQDRQMRQKAHYDQQLSTLQSQILLLQQKVKQKQQERVALAARLANLKRSYQYALRELKITEPLAEEGVVPKIELLKLQRLANDARRELTSAQLKLPNIDSAITEAQIAIVETANTFRAEQQTDLNQYQNQHATLQQSSTAFEDRVNRTQVLSPVKGQIKTLHINTLGGVIQPGMDLVEIVPTEESLVIEVKIAPKDIAFLKPGLPAKIRISAYKFTEFGALDGTLSHISPDTVEDENKESVYLVRISTKYQSYQTQKLQNPVLAIIPGMTANVDVLTGKRTVLEYLLQPLMNTHQNAFKE